MDAISFVALACAIDIFCAVLILFIAYYVNQMTVKVSVVAQQNTENAKLLLSVIQQIQHKAEVERANN
jgi:hypothetical protein